MRSIGVVACVLLAGAVVACGARSSASSAPSTPPAPERSAATPIDLELVDADVVEALREIARKANINLSVSSDVTGKVTLRVRAMPWDEALALISKQHGLQVERTNVMLVVYKHTKPAMQTFTGTPIEVRFDDTPIRDVARVFAAHAKLEIRVDDDVQASVTQHLRGVPWDFALDHIARKYELRVIRDGNAMRIAR